MKNFKILMPVLAFVMAVGMAFANKANLQTAGWVERNGIPYQLQNETCTQQNNVECQVIFANDPNTIHQVYESSDLVIPKKGGAVPPYLLDE